MSLGKWNELKGSRYDIKADFVAKEYSVTFKKAKMHDAGTYQVFFLTPTQTALDFAHSGGWSTCVFEDHKVLICYILIFFFAFLTSKNK